MVCFGENVFIAFIYVFLQQLDATELDGEVVHIIKAQLNKLFKYHKVII